MWIRIRLQKFFKFQYPTPVQTPATIDTTQIHQCFSSERTTQTPATTQIGSGSGVKQNFWPVIVCLLLCFPE